MQKDDRVLMALVNKYHSDILLLHLFQRHEESSELWLSKQVKLSAFSVVWPNAVISLSLGGGAARGSCIEAKKKSPDILVRWHGCLSDNSNGNSSEIIVFIYIYLYVCKYVSGHSGQSCSNGTLYALFCLCLFLKLCYTNMGDCTV